MLKFVLLIILLLLNVGIVQAATYEVVELYVNDTIPDNGSAPLVNVTEDSPAKGGSIWIFSYEITYDVLTKITLAVLIFCVMFAFLAKMKNRIAVNRIARNSCASNELRTSFQSCSFLFLPSFASLMCQCVL
jgi:hypothetical protein